MNTSLSRDPEVQGVVERAAAAVHTGYVARKNAAGIESCVSRHDGVTDLLGGFEALPEADKEDDRASVRAVLESLRREPVAVVLHLLWPNLSDAALEAALKEAFAVCDPPPSDLAGRCAASAADAATCSPVTVSGLSNCYCGGPEEIFPHVLGSGRYCRNPDQGAGDRRA